MVFNPPSQQTDGQLQKQHITHTQTITDNAHGPYETRTDNTNNRK